MKAIVPALLIFMFAHLCFANGKCNASFVNKVKKNLRLGRGVVLVAWGEKSKCPAESESCGDWADHLNTASRELKSLVIIKVPHQKWKNVVFLENMIISEKSALFIKQGQQSFFAKDPILEYQVYQSVVQFWSHQLGKEVQDFLPKTVNVRFCN